jgi:Auxiliary Activity family 9 (formerly GH61)
MISCTDAGKNLARAPAEFYPNCANIKVTGSGTLKPSAKMRGKFPGIYKTGGE